MPPFAFSIRHLASTFVPLVLVASLVQLDAFPVSLEESMMFARLSVLLRQPPSRILHVQKGVFFKKNGYTTSSSVARMALLSSLTDGHGFSSKRTAVQLNLQKRQLSGDDGKRPGLADRHEVIQTEMAAAKEFVSALLATEKDEWANEIENIQNETELKRILQEIQNRIDEAKRNMEIDLYGILTALEREIQLNVKAREKELKQRPSFPIEKLCDPARIRPHWDTHTTKFVCQEGWLEELQSNIEARLAHTDTGGHRVSPMALVRCSRGGKTRALHEIANLNLQYQGKRVTSIFVSFNDFSALDEADQNDPLRALLMRIAFAALKDRSEDWKKVTGEFSEFRKKNYAFSEQDILQWLGDTPAVLLVDELNNLDQLCESKSSAALKFATFIKEHFLGKEGRYFCFSSHVLSTTDQLSVFLDTASDRRVLLKKLPIIDNLPVAAESLGVPNFGAREAIYYALVPGLILEQFLKDDEPEKRKEALKQFLLDTQDHPEKREAALYNMLESLVDGNPINVPEPLHVLLDTEPQRFAKCIRWIPFHLEYIMSSFRLTDNKKVSVAKAVADLCNQLVSAKESSGDGWEAVFVLFLLARCATQAWQEDGLLPKLYSDSKLKPEVLYNEPYFNEKLPYHQCKTWEDLVDGIKPGEEPCISVYYPPNASFQVYDVMVVFSESKQIKRTYGYQLKEGGAGATRSPLEGFAYSYLVRGDPTADTLMRKNWTAPGEDCIEEFLGVTGKYWAPKKWKELTAAAAGPDLHC